MSIATIIEKLEKFTGQAEGKIVLYFTKKARGGRYSSFKPLVSGPLQEELLSIMIDALDNIKEYPTQQFNTIGTLDETIEYCDYTFVENFKDVMDSMEDENLLPEAPQDLSEFTFYLIKVKLADEDEEENDFLYFRRVTKFKKLQKGIVGRILNGDFEKVSSDLIGIDSTVDIIGYDSIFTIANHISMERIFDIKEQYKESAKQTLDLIREANLIENFEKYSEDSIQDGRIIRGLTKILENPEKVKQVNENFSKVIEVVESMDLEIQFNEDKSKMIYEDKSQLQSITFILRDAYYQTLIIERKGVDERA